MRRRDEGRDHERRRLPARDLRAGADVPLRGRRWDVRRRDRSRSRRRGRARSRPGRLSQARRAPGLDRRGREPLPALPAAARNAGVLPALRRRRGSHGCRALAAGRPGRARGLSTDGARGRRARRGAHGARYNDRLGRARGVRRDRRRRPRVARARDRPRPPARARSSTRRRAQRPRPLHRHGGGRQPRRTDAVARGTARRPGRQGRRGSSYVRRPEGEGRAPRGDDDERHAPTPRADALDAPPAALRPGRAPAPVPRADRRVAGDAPSPDRGGT